MGLLLLLGKDVGLAPCGLCKVQASATPLTREASIVVVKAHFPAFPYLHGFAFAYHLFAFTAAVASSLSFPAADSPVRFRHGVALGRSMSSTRTGATHTHTNSNRQQAVSCTICDGVYNCHNVTTLLVLRCRYIRTLQAAQLPYPPRSAGASQHRNSLLISSLAALQLFDGLH